MNIAMKSKKYKVKKKLNHTKAKLFQYVEVGDYLQFSIPLKQAGRHKNTYASYIEVEHFTYTNELRGRVYRTFNELPKLLSNFELEEMEK